MANTLEIVEILRSADFESGAVHKNTDGTMEIRLPNTTNADMDRIGALIDPLTNSGFTVYGHGAELKSKHDDFVGGMILLREAA